MYGKARLKNLLDAGAGLSVRELLPRVQEDIHAFSGGAEQSDDITMLVLRRGPPKPAALLSLPADIDRLEEVQTFIEANLDAAACPDSVKKQIELAVEEIFVNIANYAYSPATGDVEISCVPSGESVLITFSDAGKRYNPLEHEDPDIGLPAGERPVGGLGILIVKRLMNTIQYTYEAGRNRFVIGKSWRQSGQEET
jgi:sigma-B regulation protein RsbU (phosphoserine phosphatase)